MNNLNVALIQEDLVWEDSYENLRLFEKYLPELDKADLIILPEMFNTGFSMNPEKIAQGKRGVAVSWLKEKSIEQNCAMIGSIATEDNGKFYNRLCMSYPCTSVKTYDKRHLFRMGGEHEVYTAGTDNPVWPYFGWKIKGLICYDLRFPVWSRNTENYDLLIYVANWPAPRNEVWETLLKARAIENQCYVIGVNRVGEDGRGISYKGNSMVINARGEVMEQLDDNPGFISCSLSMSDLKVFREKFPVHMDADKFNVY